MQELVTRYATAADADLIADLSRQTFYDTFAPVNTKENMDKFMREQFNHELLAAEVKAPGNIFLLAIEDDKVIGYARLRENNNPKALEGLSTLEIARIYAVKNAIGKGIGKTLMEKSLEIAREKKKEWVWLGVWKENQRAIDFYKKWGFEIFAEHDFLLGDDVQKDWLMKKRID